MNISVDKKRTPLGEMLFKLPDYRRTNIKGRLLERGLTEGKWRGIYERMEAKMLPDFVREVILEELPEAEKLFKADEEKMESLM